jgi:glutamyl-Q tRNA(Asp) synthetase
MAGRFAPSPTGPLHLGSLLAATASFLEAQRRGAAWRLRFDDLDVPRSMPGAEDAIKRSLEQHGLFWDGPVDYQSQHAERYALALALLAERELAFYCKCSRRQLANHPVYPGTCRTYQVPRCDCAIRVKVGSRVITFDDAVQGPQQNNLGSTVGDFIVRRRDGLIAYQLATAVDDGGPEIDHVVRGADLLDNTPRQLYLMEQLGLHPPAYTHVPLLTHADGAKLSKQTGAEPIRPEDASRNLAHVLALLGCTPPATAQRWSCEEIIQWANDHWDPQRIPRVTSLIGQN